MDKKRESSSPEVPAELKGAGGRGGYILLSLLVGSVVAICAWYMAGRETHKKLPLAPLATAVEPRPMIPIRHDTPMVPRVMPAVMPLGMVQSLALEQVLFHQLIAQVRSGSPYGTELVLLQNLLEGAPLARDLERLSQYAQSGIPSLDRLTEMALSQIEIYHTSSQEEGNIAVRMLSSLVRVRKKSIHQAAFVEALKHHDLPSAVQEGRALMQEGYPLTDVVQSLQILEGFFDEISSLEEAFHQFLKEKMNVLKERSL